MFRECDLYFCQTEAGGKVWLVPKEIGDITTNITFSGSYARFMKGKLTVNRLKRTKYICDLVREKKDKGYSLYGSVWVHEESGAVYQSNPEATANNNGSSLKIKPSKPKPLKANPYQEIDLKGEPILETEGLYSF